MKTRLRSLLARAAALAWAPLRTPERRRTFLVMLAIFAGHIGQFLRAAIYTGPGSDGFFSWAYATSLAYDGDIELTNDYRICGHPEAVIDEGGGRPSNPFYFGPALIWTPILWVVRHLIHLPASAPEGVRHACYGPLARAVGATAPFFTMLTIYLAYRVARRWIRQPYALGGALVGAFGTTLVTYGSAMWFYSHLWSAFGVALVMFTFVRATEREESIVRWILFGMSVGFAALMRPQEGVWVILGVVWLVTPTRLRSITWNIRGLWKFLRPAVLWTVGFAAVFWIQLVVFKKIYGVYWLVPQGKMWLQLRHAHPFLMLVNGYSGWFSWTPLVWLAVIGLPLMMLSSRTRVIALGLIIASALEIYISGSALSWTGAGTFGQRMLTSLAPPVVVGAAYACERSGEWVLRRRWRSRFILTLAWTFPLMFVTWGTPWVRNPTHAPEAYSLALAKNFADINKEIGNPFDLPGNAAMALRYRMPVNKVNGIVTDFYFVRHYRTTRSLGGDVVNFAKPTGAVYFAEGVTQEDGARIKSGRGRMLIHIYWPYVTAIKLGVRLNGAPQATLRLVAKGLLGSTDLGSKTYTNPEEVLEWPMPKGGWDSGINDIEVYSDADVTLTSLEWIDTTKHDLSLF